ncbi:hypothetical protein GCM10010402_60040 [Actinomadura luteofluorescens]|uniref:imine reductase family protein n=1 Tax=Actinomadura luteofluorescens TaxID=46163 RepID=UPI00216418EE|nr:hypothetical protein [Actinomadura glauciflava]MCR3743536.1 hypothetical protein [Actinomadura glauciflava]
MSLLVGLVADPLPGLAADIDAGRFSGTESASLASVTASLGHIVHALEEAGVSPAVTQAAKNTVDAAVSAGHEGDSAARLAEFLGRGHTDRDPQAAG